jgi:hypothetical protein
MESLSYFLVQEFLSEFLQSRSQAVVAAREKGRKKGEETRLGDLFSIEMINMVQVGDGLQSGKVLLELLCRS